MLIGNVQSNIMLLFREWSDFLHTLMYILSPSRLLYKLFESLSFLFNGIMDYDAADAIEKAWGRYHARKRNKQTLEDYFVCETI